MPEVSCFSARFHVVLQVLPGFFMRHFEAHIRYRVRDRVRRHVRVERLEVQVERNLDQGYKAWIKLRGAVTHR